MDVLSCKTPEMAVKEIWVYLLAYNLIRLVMAQAALVGCVNPRDISFKHSLQLWLLWEQQAVVFDEKILYQFCLLLAQQRLATALEGLSPGQ